MRTFDKRECAGCGQEYEPTGPSQKFCTACRESRTEPHADPDETHAAPVIEQPATATERELVLTCYELTKIAPNRFEIIFNNVRVLIERTSK
jgi:hypothetical protein